MLCIINHQGCTLKIPEQLGDLPEWNNWATRRLLPSVSLYEIGFSEEVILDFKIRHIVVFVKNIYT